MNELQRPPGEWLPYAQTLEIPDGGSASIRAPSEKPIRYLKVRNDKVAFANSIQTSPVEILVRGVGVGSTVLEVIDCDGGFSLAQVNVVIPRRIG